MHHKFVLCNIMSDFDAFIQKFLAVIVIQSQTVDISTKQNNRRWFAGVVVRTLDLRLSVAG